MNHDEQYYRIDLESYIFPRCTSALLPYFGTMEQLLELMGSLSADCQTSRRYRSTIEAVDGYTLNPNATHIMAGREIPILTPCTRLMHSSVTMADPNWLRSGFSDARPSIKARELEAEQILLQEGNETIHRCVRVRFRDLQVYINGFGWIYPGDSLRGFPYQIRYDRSTQEHSMQLFMLLRNYESSDAVQAVKDMGALSKEDLSILCNDILGEV